MIDGQAQIDGARILQRIKGGRAGVSYVLRCKFDTEDGDRLVVAAVLQVKAANGDS